MDKQRIEYESQAIAAMTSAINTRLKAEQDREAVIELFTELYPPAIVQTVKAMYYVNWIVRVTTVTVGKVNKLHWIFK